MKPRLYPEEEESTDFPLKVVQNQAFDKGFKQGIKKAEQLIDSDEIIVIRMKDIPAHMVGIDLTWIDKEIAKIKDRFKKRLNAELNGDKEC